MTRDDAPRFGRVPSAYIKGGGLREVGGADLLVYVTIAAYAGEGFQAWPSIDTLAQIVGKHRRNVQRSVSRLVADGHITADRRGGKSNPTRYQLTSKGDAQDATLTNLKGDAQGATLTDSKGGVFRPKGGVCAPKGDAQGATRTRNKEQRERAAEGEALVFPVRGGETYSLTKAKASEYQTTYPALDVRGELRKARQWLLDNPGRRKTARGMTKFVGGWLSRASKDTQAATAPVGVLDADPVEPPDEIFTDE